MASINMPSKKESGLDKVAKALGIAKDVFGMAVDFNQFRSLNQQMDARNASMQQDQADAAEANNPNSPIMSSIRQRHEAAGLKLPEGMTYSQYKQSGYADDLAAAGAEKLKEREIALKGEQERKTALAKGETKKASPDQFKVAGFVKRAEQADDALGQLMTKGYDPTAFSASVQDKGAYPEYFKSGDFKSFEQAQRNFVSAVLRRESGAAISDSEYNNERRKYFPMPGDNADTIALKEAARQQAIASLKAEAGEAYDKVPTIKAPSIKNTGGLINRAYADEQNKKVRVSNGKESYLIDPSDVNAATKDGFKVIK